MQLKARVNRLEASAPIPEHERITEVHHHIINPDRTPVLNPDGSPMVIVRQLSASQVPPGLWMTGPEGWLGRVRRCHASSHLLR
jgi:hypothetical protein